MTISVSTARRVAKPFLRFGAVLLFAALPFSLTAQQGPATPSAAAPSAAVAKAYSPDEVLKTEGYMVPPAELADAVLIPRYLNIALTNASHDKKWFLDEIGDGPVLMKTFSKPYHELGGVFIDFKANRARSLTNRTNIGIQIISAADGTRKPIAIPAGARISNATWSPDGKAVAYFVHAEDSTHIWMTDIATNKPVQITKTPVLATLVTTFEFTQDGKQIATVLIPDGRSPMPVAAGDPDGPGREDCRRRKEPPPHVPEPDDDPVRADAARVALDGPARVDRRRDAGDQEGRPADDDPLDRRLAGRQVRARHPDGAAVLLRRPGQQLRIDRGDLGHRRQDAREAERSPDQHGRRRTTRSRRPIRRQPPAAGARAQNQQGRARARVARGRPGAHLSRAGAGPRGLDRRGGRPRRPRRRTGRGSATRTIRRPAAAARRRARPARTTSTSGCRRSPRGARRCSSRATRACRTTATHPTCRRCSSASAPGRTRSSTPSRWPIRRSATRSRATAPMTCTRIPDRS